MKQHPVPSAPETIAPVVSERPDRDRRRFVIGGLVAAPLLVTLAARPALARTGSLGNYGSAPQ